MLHNFGSGSDGTYPVGAPVLDAQRNLYGVTGGAGTYGYGLVFQLTPSADGQWNESVPFNFTSETGGASQGGIVANAASNLFVSTYAVSPGGTASVFELSPINDGWSYQELSDLAGCCLTMNHAGDLLGVIGPGNYFGAGAIGQLSPGADGWTYNQLYSFCNLPRCADGNDVLSPLTWDTKGDLYGMTESGGKGYGVVFELARKPASMDAGERWVYHMIHTFSGTGDGQRPVGGVAVDNSGNVYGTTGYGGAYDNGTVFKLTPLAGSTGLWTETILYDFPNVEQAFPYGNLLLDPAGNLYGINAGGAGGTIFKLSLQQNGSWAYSVVHSFDGADGNHPEGITTDGKGNLFGTTMTGGTYDRGVVFEILP